MQMPESRRAGLPGPCRCQARHRHKVKQVNRNGWYRYECAYDGCDLVEFNGAWLALEPNEGWDPIPPDEGDW